MAEDQNDQAVATPEAEERPELNVTVEDAGKYRVTAKNELGESNATISLNFDSEWHRFIPTQRPDPLLTARSVRGQCNHHPKLDAYLIHVLFHKSRR